MIETSQLPRPFAQQIGAWMCQITADMFLGSESWTVRFNIFHHVWSAYQLIVSEITNFNLDARSSVGTGYRYDDCLKPLAESDALTFVYSGDDDVNETGIMKHIISDIMHGGVNQIRDFMFI